MVTLPPHAALGLHALQHRGQEAAGIVTFDGAHFHSQRAMGLVGDKFSSPSVIEGLPGHAAIGHVRYATTRRHGCCATYSRCSPISSSAAFALGHNGNLTNAMMLRRQLVAAGLPVPVDHRHRSHRPSDGAAASGRAVIDRMVDALRAGRGRLFAGRPCHDMASSACRDPLGVRPLVLGKLDGALDPGIETCALDIIGAEFVRDVEPGEMIVIDARRRSQPAAVPAAEPRRFCIFEYIYFARPDSVVEGMGVYEARKRIGAELARESAVPSRCDHPGARQRRAGAPSAMRRRAGIPFELGIIRNHYVGRTFIEPTDQIRNLGVKLKHNANRVT